MDPSDPDHATTDQATLRQLFAGCRSLLLHRIELMLGPAAKRIGEAEDFLNTTCARVLEAGAELRVVDDIHFARLATRIARHLILDQVKRKRVQRFDSLGSAMVHGFAAHSSVASPVNAAIKDEDRELVFEAIEMLGDDHRTVIELRDFQSLSFQEIALRLGRNENAAQLLHSRAVVKLGLALRKLMQR